MAAKADRVLRAVLMTAVEADKVYATRAEVEQALWTMADDGRADCHHDRRYLALVLLATFASLRWGEVTALRRCDIDLAAAPCESGRRWWSGPRVRSCPARPSRGPGAVSSASPG